jgi:hypothetical protein
VRDENDAELGKRELDPAYTRGYVHIPRLRDKLPWLYALHPSVDSQKKLAMALRISPAQLSTWLNGTRYTDARTIAPLNPDSIPIKHFRSFIDIWGLPAEILEIDDVAEFRSAIEHFEGGRGAWEKLVRAVADDDRIEILVEAATRGIIDPEEEEETGIPLFREGERIMLRVADPGLRHGAMLEQDRSGWICLRPNPRWRETELEGAMIFPRQRPDLPPRFARLEGGGMHRVLVILSAEALPARLIDLLMRRPIDVGVLNYAATILQDRLAGGDDKCRLMSRRFLVSSATAREI